MAWTAIAQAPEDRGNLLRIAVAFSDGARTVSEPFDLYSADDFNNFPLRVDQRKAQIEALFDAAAKFVPGVIAPPVVIEPSQEDVDLKLFQELIQEYQGLVSQLKLGVKNVTQSDVDAAADAIKIAYEAALVAKDPITEKPYDVDNRWTPQLRGVFP